MLCFSVAQILGWVEQHKMVRELSGRPDVTLEVRYNTHFLLKTNNVAAVDLTIQDIVIPFPARTTQRLEQLADATVRPEERSGVGGSMIHGKLYLKGYKQPINGRNRCRTVCLVWQYRMI
jgi:hypothetical protein